MEAPGRAAALLHGLSALLALLALLYRLMRLRSLLPAAVRWAVRALRSLASSKPPGELGEALQQRALQSKVRQCRALLALLALLLAYAQLQRGRSLWSHEAQLPRAQDLVAFGLQGVCTWAVLRPGSLTAWSLDIFYVGLALGASLYACPFSVTAKSLPNALLAADLLLLLANCCRRTVQAPRAPLFVVCNTFFALCALGAVLVHGGEAAARMARLQALALAALVAGPQLLEALHLGWLHRSLCLEEVKEMHEASCALLRSFCECTVELDFEGAIVGDPESLGGYLTKGAFAYCLSGSRLSDLVVNADERKNFQQRLREPKMRHVAECMPVSVKDARVELRWFRYRYVDGQQRFLVGLRELSQHRPDMDASVGQGWLPAGPKPAAARLPLGPSAFEGSWSTSVTSDDPGAAILAVDCLSEGFPVRGQTSGFAAQLGRLPSGASLADYVRRPQEFMAWVQRQALQECPGSCSVVLRLPAGRFGASCKVLVQGAEESEVSTSNCLEEIGLLFTEVRPLARSRPGAMRGTPSTPSVATASI